MIARSIETVFVMLTMMGVGWWMSRIGWLNEGAKKFINKYIVNVAVPALTLTNFLQMFPKDMIGQTVRFVGVAMGSMAIMMLLSEMIGRMIRIERLKSGSFSTLSSLSNSMFFGMPIALSLFGEVALPYILFYYMANSIMFWGVCAPRIMKDGKVKIRRISENLKKVLNAPFVAILVAMVLLALDWTLPSVVMETAGYLGRPVTPLAAIFIGRIIYEIDFKQYVFERSMAVVLILKFAVSPGIMLIITRFLGFDVLSTQVFVMMAAMPSVVQTTLVSELYGVDAKYTAFVISLATILGLLFIPVYMYALSFL
jgi:hypothetical protein